MFFEFMFFGHFSGGNNLIDSASKSPPRVFGELQNRKPRPFFWDVFRRAWGGGQGLQNSGAGADLPLLHRRHGTLRVRPDLQRGGPRPLIQCVPPPAARHGGGLVPHPRPPVPLQPVLPHRPGQCQAAASDSGPQCFFFLFYLFSESSF